MRVLWFVNVPIPPIGVALPSPGDYVGSGWWISWLAAALRRRAEIDLHIAWGHEGRYHNVARIDSHCTVEVFPLWRASVAPTPGSVTPGLGGMFSLLTKRFPTGAHAVVERVKPDLIHIHGTEGPCASLLERVAIPSLVSIQGSPGDWAVRYWGGADWAAKIRNPRNWKNYLQFVLAGQRETRMLKHVKAIHGGTSWDRRFARRTAPQASFHHAVAAVGPDFFRVRHLVGAGSDREKVVMTAFSPQPYKGAELVINAVASLRRSGHRVRLVLAGSCPPKGWGREILRAAHSAGPGAVEITGYLQPRALSERLAAADVYVLPSYIENAPNTLLEAMCVGVPCVAARVGGVASMLQDGVEGLIFRRGNLRDLTAKLERLLVDAEFASTLGLAGAARVRAADEPMAVAARTIEIYRSVLDGACRRVA
jgi:glycosyltransferase involved in cell wall biosynthesis